MIYARRGTQHHRRRAAHCAPGRKLTALPDFLPVRESTKRFNRASPSDPTSRTQERVMAHCSFCPTAVRRMCAPLLHALLLRQEKKQQQHLSAPLIRVSPHLCIGGVSVSDFTLNGAVPTGSYFGDNGHIMQCEKLSRRRRWQPLEIILFIANKRLNGIASSNGRHQNTCSGMWQERNAPTGSSSIKDRLAVSLNYTSFAATL